MRKCIALVLAGLSLTVAPIAFAAPVNLTGEISVKYEKDTANGDPSISGTMNTFKLIAEKDLGDGWSLYARLGAQYATQPQLADFNIDAYSANKKAVVGLDQFGFNYKRDNVTYKIGRQDVTIGKDALLYSKHDEYIGKHNFIDDITATGTLGLVEIAAVLAQEDNADAAKNKVYSLRAGYNPTESFNYGLTLGRYQVDGGESTNHWAVDGTYKFGKSSLTTQFTKSNHNADNKAYATTLNYDFTEKMAMYVTGFRVEQFGDMGGNSDFDNNNRGFYYGITHQFNKNDGLEIVYKGQKNITNGQKNAKLEATLSHTF